MSTHVSYAARIASFRVDHHAPTFVAIDGRSGSGKTSLARLLASEMDALVISGDDFFNGGVTLRDDPPQVLAAECIDWRTIRTVLDDLRSTGSASYAPFDWAAFDGSVMKTEQVIEARDFVILEGVYSARPQLRDLMDCCVLVTAPKAVRMERLIKREGTISAWERQWHRGEDWYFSHVVQDADFDLVV